MNIAMLLDMAADAFPQRIAVTCAGRSLNYLELRSAARAAAERIDAAGCRHAALLDTNNLATPVALFAAAYAGLPYVPLNYRLAQRELEELLLRIAPASLVTQREHVEHLTLPANILALEGGSLLSPASEESGATREPPQDPGAVVIQLFTSGTTGKPKAAVLRHENVMSYILGTIEFGSAAEEEATLLAVPPYHIAGIAAVLSSIYAGRRIVMLPSFEAADWVRLAIEERITQAFVVPTMLVRIMDYIAQQGAAPRFPALRAIAYGGGKMPLAIIERALEVFADVNFTNAYGLTETSSTICLLTPEEHRAAASSRDPQLRRRLVSVGRPLPGIELEVRNEAGKRLGPGVPGFIFVRGAQVAGEYHGTGRLLDSAGWFATQDRGRIDADGYVFLEGRADDVIVRGGENISPGEIEEALLAHPAVADAVVVAIPSEQWGEAVGAAVVVKPGVAVTAEALQLWVRERLRSTRVPERIVFRRELPYNELGKVLRRVVRQELGRSP